MHQSFDISHAFWNFLIVFAFAWIILFTAEPAWVQTNGAVSKSLCAWYAFIIALVLAFILLVVFLIMRLVKRKAITEKAVSFMDRMGLDGDAAADAYRSVPGERPVDKMKNILDTLKEEAKSITQSVAPAKSKTLAELARSAGMSDISPSTSLADL